MPSAEVQAFCDGDDCPLNAWLADLKKDEPRGWKKCLYLISCLESDGRSMSMPLSKPLRDGIFELRGKVGTVNYRLFYGFIGLSSAVVSHGITKEREVPDDEIDLAVTRLGLAKSDPSKYTTDIEL